MQPPDFALPLVLVLSPLPLLSRRVHLTLPPPPPPSSSLSSAEQIGDFAQTPLTITAKRGLCEGLRAARRGGRTRPEGEEEEEEDDDDDEDEVLLRLPNSSSSSSSPLRPPRLSFSFSSSARDHAARRRDARIVPCFRFKKKEREKKACLFVREKRVFFFFCF